MEIPREGTFMRSGAVGAEGDEAGFEPSSESESSEGVEEERARARAKESAVGSRLETMVEEEVEVEEEGREVGTEDAAAATDPTSLLVSDEASRSTVEEKIDSMVVIDAPSDSESESSLAGAAGVSGASTTMEEAATLRGDFESRGTESSQAGSDTVSKLAGMSSSEI